MFDDHTAFPGGFIYMKTDKQYYYSGDVVFGKIYLRVVDQPLKAKKLDVRIKGTEKVSWHVHEKTGEDSDGDDIIEKKFKSFKRCHIDFRETCFHF